MKVLRVVWQKNPLDMGCAPWPSRVRVRRDPRHQRVARSLVRSSAQRCVGGVLPYHSCTCQAAAQIALLLLLSLSLRTVQQPLFFRRCEPLRKCLLCYCPLPTDLLGDVTVHMAGKRIIKSNLNGNRTLCQNATFFQGTLEKMPSEDL